VTEKDLLVTADFLGPEEIPRTRVKEFMSKTLITFPEEASVKEVMQALVRENIKRVPIVRDGKVVGIVSRRDILKTINQGSGV